MWHQSISVRLYVLRALVVLLGSGCGASQTDVSFDSGLIVSWKPDGLILSGTLVHANVTFRETTTTCISTGYWGDTPDCTDEVEEYAVTLDSVECQELGCTARKVAKDGFEIQSSNPGTVHVKVAARRDTSSDVIIEDRAVDFSDVVRFEIFRLSGQGHGVAHPVLRDTEFYWCARALGNGPNGESGLFIPSNEAEFVTDGSILVGESVDTFYDDNVPKDGLIDCLHIRATQAGTGTFVARFAGKERVGTLEVISPFEVAKAKVHDLFPIVETRGVPESVVRIPISIDEPSMESCGASSIRVGETSAPVYGRFFAWAFELRDGRTAVGAAPVISPRSWDGVIRMDSSNGSGRLGDFSGMFRLVEFHAGTSTLTISLDETLFTIPVYVEPSSVTYVTCDDSTR